ncbi:MAG TPA: O-antigen ligase family protein, partial [Candidatus Woesebacteria bacterium]|nr:O-antigen ligase family protein [Candidatus Woesebacteria bacterium]
FDIRKVVWKGAIDLGLRYPYFGSGVETFAYSYYFTRPEAHNLTSEWDFIYNKAHNEYLNYFATTGFVGVSAYLILIISVFILFWRYYEQNPNKMKVEKDTLLVTCVMLGFVTILITNFFGFSVSTIQILCYLTPAIVIALMQPAKEFKPLTFKYITIHKKIALVVCSIIFIWGIWYIQNYYIADVNYAKAKIKMAQNEYTDALILLDAAIKSKYEHVYEDKMSYTLANLAFIYSFSDEKERANKYILLADVANLKTLEYSPENIQYWRTRGKNYYLFYQITNSEEDLQKALVAFEKVTAIAKTDVQSKYTLALFNWIASREVTDSEKSALLYGRALDEIRTVIDMKPNYMEAQELLSEILAGA